MRLIILFLMIEALVYMGFWLLSDGGESSALVLKSLYVFNSSLVAAKYVALYTQMMIWAKGTQSGVDFSLFQSMDMIVAIAMAVFSGWLVSFSGYSTLFICASSVTIAAVLILFLCRNQQQACSSLIES
ncbi:hypothetical protein [Vibrio sonorensis]|uniref:hypothetical protein n=1 Tax=Vibrio sonorensis TaxID=1004316 RepID=UPI001FE08408|nr:hypothetical protein [Vibrio sonorensis]